MTMKKFHVCMSHDSCMYIYIIQPILTKSTHDRVTTNDHEWPQMDHRWTTSDHKWPREWQKAVSEQIVIKEATSVSLCGYLSVGQLNNGKWPACFARIVMPANRAFQNWKSGWSTSSFFCRFDLANEARQMGEMAKFARCPVCKNNCKLL